MGDSIDGFPDGFAVGVDGLQLGAEEFTGVGVNVLDLQPVGLSGGLLDSSSLSSLSSLSVSS